MSRDPFDDGVDVDAAWNEIVANWDAGPESPDEPTDDESDPDRADTDARADGEPRPPSTTPGADVDRPEPEPGPDDPASHPRAGDARPSNRPHSPIHRPSGPRPRHLDTHHLNPHPSGPRDADPDGPSLLDGLDDDNEGYIPPEPPPLPRPGLVNGLAWLGAIGAPAFLLVAALFWRTIPALWIGAAVLAFVAGFITLVIRLPDRDDETDDGAVV